MISDRLLASCSSDKTIKIWDLEDNECVATLICIYFKNYNKLMDSEGLY